VLESMTCHRGYELVNALAVCDYVEEIVANIRVAYEKGVSRLEPMNHSSYMVDSPCRNIYGTLKFSAYRRGMSRSVARSRVLTIAAVISRPAASSQDARRRDLGLVVAVQ
jgi:hypothetical protein